MSDFKAVQQAFIQHIKDPDNHAFDGGIEDRRLNIYRELFFNNVLGFLSTGFPVLESIYGEQQWRRLARDFFAHHDCRSPYFVDISKEFVEFLSNEYQPQDGDPPFLQELAHYEWLELAISVRHSDEHYQPWDQMWPLGGLVFSPLAELVGYQFPVHLISDEFQPDAPSEEPVYLVVYRDEDDDVQFTLVNMVTAHLLTLIQQSPGAGFDDLVSAMQAALPQIPADQVAAGTEDTIRQMLSAGVLFPTT